MKVTKLLPLIALTIMVASCNKPAGELVGSYRATNFREANPYGMLFIKKGSFMMGANTQSAVFEQPDNVLMVTVDAFWMDETEITNSEYHQFVDWVRDSVAMTYLVAAGMTDFAVQPKDEDFDEENFALNWNKKVPWKSKEEEVVDALAPMYYSDGGLNTNHLHYRYCWVNMDEALPQRNKFDVATSTYPPGATARVDTFWVNENGEIKDSTIIRPLKEPKDLLTTKIICIYPDTLVWARDFQFSYNDPLLHMYFKHPAYGDYPVVGVTWEQAHAFCNWRTKYFNRYAVSEANEYRLPTEAQWEYAARGGRKMAMYPWGGNYARDGKGCFFANFKPYRGAYNDDTGTTTMKVAQFRPNDFGLFDMAGNVAEWTNSAYQSASNTHVHDLNPDYNYMARKADPDILKRKVVRGGSWKDISYFMQCGVRTYEYQYESRPYIGFRCVRAYIGD
ncbi:MAG: SUMF1/EgtB/PvdO family nonheme iron enzyme [Paludibacteraceae bacterium]|nr:SUMF1/EgtB/PvdO family nonheme iron enzyme [Paludibacteraceae bacterium]